MKIFQKKSGVVSTCAHPRNKRFNILMFNCCILVEYIFLYNVYMVSELFFCIENYDKCLNSKNAIFYQKMPSFHYRSVVVCVMLMNCTQIRSRFCGSISIEYLTLFGNLNFCCLSGMRAHIFY